MRNLCAFFAVAGSISIDKWQNCLAVSELRKSADSRSYYFLPRIDAGGGFSFSAEFDAAALLSKELIYAEDNRYVSYLPSSLLKKERNGVSADILDIKEWDADKIAEETSRMLFGETPTLGLGQSQESVVYFIVSDKIPPERYVSSVLNAEIKNVLDISEIDPRLPQRSPVSTSGLMSLYGIGFKYMTVEDNWQEIIASLCDLSKEMQKIALSLDTETFFHESETIQKELREQNIGFIELPLAGKR